ncbi:hypothetical protein [Ciceribacter azotifigens]|uniref:hypothetical protein n=1 Tax=Ciceribacter azotifigens TaxID=2069303 RepID=UPI003A896823
MTRQSERAATIIRGMGTASLGAIVLLCASIVGTAVALADRDSPQFHRGACEGSYPGWLRGVVDGYHDLSLNAVNDPSIVLRVVPTPEELTSADERLGYGEGLQEGFRLGVSYGAEMGKAARASEPDLETMQQYATKFSAFAKLHCGDLIPALNWDTTFMNTARTATLAGLHEALLAMVQAVGTNQQAAATEKLIRQGQEAEARGEHETAARYRETAQYTAQMAAELAQLARSHAAAGREEAVQAIIDAEAAAERAKKALDGAGR